MLTYTNFSDTIKENKYRRLILMSKYGKAINYVKVNTLPGLNKIEDIINAAADFYASNYVEYLRLSAALKRHFSV